MENDQLTDNCFVIPVDSSFLVYSPLNGITVLLNRAGVRELKEQLFSFTRDHCNPESPLYPLVKDILESPVKVPVRRSGNIDPEFIGIIPTRSCNGACNYCDFGSQNASSLKMSFQMAAGFVDWYANLLKSGNRNKMEIHFFGGEPMNARDVIEAAVQRARLVCADNKLIPYFEISTNGQFDARDARFLGQYFNKIVLSLDGFAEVQDKHRPLKGNKSSFRNAIETAKIIGDSNAMLCIRSCVSRENIQSMEEFTRWMCENLKISTINFEILTSNPQSDSAGLFPPDPVEFAIRFQKSREIANDFDIEVVYASDISSIPAISSCPVGKDTAIVTPDGRISNCYLMPESWQNAGLDLGFGFIDDSGLIIINNGKVSDIRRMTENKKRCTNCFCKWSCAGGCHVGNTFPGSNPAYNDFCKQTRLISAFTLLSDLQLQDRIDDLTNLPDALQKIACQASDKIQEFN